MPPANDNFADAEVLTGDVGEVVASTVGATWQTGEPGNNRATIWYQWTPSVSGDVRIRARGIATNAIVGSPGLHPATAQAKPFTGSAVNALTAVADTAPGNVYGYSYPVVGGTTYFIQVQFPGQQGTSPFASLVGTITMTWNLNPPPPLAFKGAASAQTTGTTVTVATPPGAEVNDVMFAFVAWDTAAGSLTAPASTQYIQPLTNWHTVPVGSSWGNVFGDLGGGTGLISVYGKVVDSGDVAGATHSWSTAGASPKAAAIVSYAQSWVSDAGAVGLRALFSPGAGSSTRYRVSAGGSGSGGGEGSLNVYVPDTVQVSANATRGGSGGALTITNGATELAREDGPVPLIVTETAATYTFPSATEKFTFRLLLAPDNVFGDLGIIAVGGWGVGMVRMGAN